MREELVLVYLEEFFMLSAVDEVWKGVSEDVVLPYGEAVRAHVASRKLGETGKHFYRD